jgi:carboxyl-terminal processing protease
MKLNFRLTGIFLAAAALAAGVAVYHNNVRAEPAPGDLAVVDFADKVSSLVRAGQLDELKKLSAPAEAAKLDSWRSDYVGAIQKSEAQRAKELNEAISKAQDFQKRGKLDEAVDRSVRAYMITKEKDQEAFLKLDWVAKLTEEAAAKAADLEKKGEWLESLQLYSDLNSLFEMSTKYKPDMQRLARRTRLIALYTPAKFYEMRKALIAKQEKEKPADGKEPPEDTTPATFPKWEDHVKGITPDMLEDACDKAVADWVEKTSYAKLMEGGAASLRLFLSTPELYGEFPNLKDEAKRKAFEATLDDALAAAGKEDFTGPMFHKWVRTILESNEKTIELPRTVAIMEFTDGSMERLDPFTAIIWPGELAEFNKNITGSFGGVGVQISLEKGLLTVISPLEDTPAWKAGMQAGDVITAIDGKSTVGITIDQAVRTIMGQAGTQVKLRVKREGLTEEKEFEITRAQIKVSSVKGVKRDMSDPENPKWDFMIDKENKIGYIRVTGFQEETTHELEAALAQLKSQGLQGLILDLRFNPGGLLKAAVDISDLFLDQGTIVSTKGRTLRAGEYKWQAHKDVAVDSQLPITVLINQYSASASEILSGALKINKRALIVGQRSFGKGSVQNILFLPEGAKDAEMKLTMSYYYLPNGESLHRKDGATTWGVEPQVLVELSPDQLSKMLKQRRDSDIIQRAAGAAPTTSAPATSTAPSTGPATTTAANEPVIDTQLDTSLLLLRLQLVGQPKQAASK